MPPKLNRRKCCRETSEKITEPNLPILSPFKITDSKQQTSPHSTTHTVGGPGIYHPCTLDVSITLWVSCLCALLNSELGEGMDWAHSSSTRSAWVERRTRGETRSQKSVNNEGEKKYQRENAVEQRSGGHSHPMLEYFHRR